MIAESLTPKPDTCATGHDEAFRSALEAKADLPQPTNRDAYIHYNLNR
jgi:hypothetical protein